jgi:hypothetical protein
VEDAYKRMTLLLLLLLFNLATTAIVNCYCKSRVSRIRRPPSTFNGLRVLSRNGRGAIGATWVQSGECVRVCSSYGTVWYALDRLSGKPRSRTGQRVERRLKSHDDRPWIEWTVDCGLWTGQVADGTIVVM